MSPFEAGRAFLHAQARLLERRVFACRFEGASPQGVVEAVRGYRNDDGGFGFALEPDLRAPTSQPIFVEIALQAMYGAGAFDSDLLQGACDWLQTVGAADGAVGPALPDALEFPRADHWNGDWAVTPSLNPTAAIAGYLHAAGCDHAWVGPATRWCLAQIDAEPITSAHTLRAAMRLTEALGDDARTAKLASQLDAAEWFQRSVPVTSYTMTPLHFPRALFDDATLAAHLDDLVARQQDDGGWPVLWEAPGAAATAEWRGRWTLDSLVTLRSFGRS